MFLIRHQGGGGGRGQVINPKVLKNSIPPLLPPRLPCVSPSHRQRNLSLAVSLSGKALKSATGDVRRGGCRRRSRGFGGGARRCLLLAISSPPLGFSRYRRCNHPEAGLETRSVIRLSENNKVFVNLKLFHATAGKGWGGGMWSNQRHLRARAFVRVRACVRARL